MRGEIYYELASASKSAGTVAAEMLSVQSIAWNVGAFVLPEGYSFSGSPAKGVEDVARVYGAIVRADDAGNFVMTDRFPGMFPPWGAGTYPSGTPDFELDTLDAVLDGPSYADVDGEDYDSVEVAAQDLRGGGLDIEVATESPAINVTTEIRVFWPEELWAAGIYPVYSLAGPTQGLGIAGSLSYQGRNFGEYTETLTFQNGEARTRHIIDSVGTITPVARETIYQSLTWYNWRGENTIHAVHNVTGNPISGIYEVTYTTHFLTYHLTTGTPGKYLVGFAAPATDAPKKYQFGVGANPAPRIEDQYLTDAAGKEFRAVSVLKASSSMKRVSMELPMTTQIRDGMICSFSDPVFGLSGNFWVDRVEMNIEAIKMTYKLDLLQCHKA